MSHGLHRSGFRTDGRIGAAPHSRRTGGGRPARPGRRGGGGRSGGERSGGGRGADPGGLARTGPRRCAGASRTPADSPTRCPTSSGRPPARAPSITSTGDGTSTPGSRPRSRSRRWPGGPRSIPRIWGGCWICATRRSRRARGSRPTSGSAIGTADIDGTWSARCRSATTRAGCSAGSGRRPTSTTAGGPRRPRGPANSGSGSWPSPSRIWSGPAGPTASWTTPVTACGSTSASAPRTRCSPPGPKRSIPRTARTTESWERSLGEGIEFHVEYRLRGADGEYRWFLGHALPQRDDAGRLVGWYGTCTDIDTQWRSRQEIVRLNRSLKARVRRARDALRDRADLHRHRRGRSVQPESAPTRRWSG